MLNIFKTKYNKKDKIKKFEEIYFMAINDVQKNEKYISNEMDIECIKKVLKEHTDAPEDLIEWLVEKIEEKVELEYEFAKEYIIKKL